MQLELEVDGIFDRNMESAAFEFGAAWPVAFRRRGGTLTLTAGCVGEQPSVPARLGPALGPGVFSRFLRPSRRYSRLTSGLSAAPRPIRTFRPRRIRPAPRRRPPLPHSQRGNSPMWVLRLR